MTNYRGDPAAIVTSDLTGCAVQLPNSEQICGKPSVPDPPFPICVEHLAKILRRFRRNPEPIEISRERIKIDQFRRAEELEAQANERAAARQAFLENQAVVYYVALPGDMVKIGTTVNLAGRLAQLRLDDDAVLATEPGTYPLERARKREFAEYRIGKRENFTRGERLLSHIDMLVRHYGPPTITNAKGAPRY